MIRTFCLVLLFVPTAFAAEPVTPTPDEIAKAIQRLGADDYHAREQATVWLWAAGPAAEDALKAGLRSADAEVVARCRDLLDKIPYGIAPDMPPRFVELIAMARAGGAGGWPGVAPALLDLGPRGMDVARKLIDRLAENDGQRDTMRRILDLEGWRVATALLAAGQIDRAGDLLERSAVAAALTPNNQQIGIRHYVAFLTTRNALADQLPRWRAFAAKNANQSGDADGRLPDGSPDGRISLTILTYLARLHGDFAEARHLADEIGRADLKESILFDQGAWADLATLSPLGMDQAMTIGLKARYLAAAGPRYQAEATAVLNELKSMSVHRSPSMGPPRVFCALMFADRPTDALAVLEKSKFAETALLQFEILCQQHRYTEAFAKLDKAVDERSAVRWQWDTAKLRTFYELGERDKFQKTLAALSSYETLSPAEATPAKETIEFLVGLDRPAEALPIAAAVLNNIEAAPAEVFGKLFPKAPLAAEIWWRYERLQHPSEPMGATVARLPPLLDKRLMEPEGRAALEAATKVARVQPDPDADRWLQGLAEACQLAGLEQQARAFCKEAAERTNSAAAWLRLGDLHAEAKLFAEAAQTYEHAWRADTKQALSLWLRGWAQEKAGQPGGKEARDLAQILPLGDDEARYKLAEEFAKRSAFGPELIAAARDERRLVVRFSSPGNNIGRNAQGMLSSDPGAYADHLKAADSTQRFLLELLRTNGWFKKEQGYLVVLNRLANQRAQGLLANGDASGAFREAVAALSYLPGHNDPIMVLVPELAKRGHTTAAARLYTAAATEQDRLCKDYPHSATFLDGRALLAARCHRDLDLAVDHARKAVELEPTRSSYRETLAEALFQHGDKADAVAEIKRCIEMEPKITYYAKQRARMEAGDPAAALPER